MRLKTIVKAISVAAIAVVVALIAVVKSIDFNEYKHVLSQQVRGATGRDLIISGPLELKLGLVPSVVATEIRFDNMATGSRPVMAGIQRIEAKVALLPLLFREVQVHRLILVGADIMVETDAKGRANWRFDGAGGPAAVPSTPEADTPPTRFDIREMRIEDSRITWRDGVTGETRLVRISLLSFAPEQGGKLLDVTVKGEVDHTVLDLAGKVGGLDMLGGQEPWPVKLKGNVDQMVVAATGTIRDPLAATGLDVVATVSGEELATPLVKAGMTVPSIGPFKLSARLTDKDGILAATEIDAAAGRKDLALASAKGAIQDLGALSGIALTVSVETDDLAALSELAGSDLPPRPAKASANLSDHPGGWSLSNLQASLGDSQVTGELDIGVNGRSHVAGKLNSPLLVLKDFDLGQEDGSPEDGVPEDGAPDDGKLFPDEELPFELLAEMDADIAVTIDRLDADGTEVTGVSAHIVLDNGKLKIEPASATIAGGTLGGMLRIDSRDGKQAAIKLALTGKEIEAGLLSAFDGHLSGARTDIDIDLAAKGNSVRAIMAGLTGTVLISAGEGSIHNTTINWAGDVVFQALATLNPLARAEETTQLNCAVIRFKLTDGKAITRKGIAIETAKVNVVGSGSVDLRSEALDMGITPRGRQGFNVGSLAALTRIGGTLSEPRLTVDAMGTARTAASVGAAVATGGLSLLGELLFDTATTDRNPCRTALKAR